MQAKRTVIVNENNVKVRPHYESLISGSNRALSARLTRANSLDIQSPMLGQSVLTSGGKSPSSAHQDFRPKEDEKQQLEVKHLADQLAVLREELYMKSGELANLKEFADRTNATKSDVIHRLENSLAHERETSRRQLSEASTQLAFREADYRMVCTELTRLKGQLIAQESVPTVTGATDPTVDFSPASQLIAAVSFSPSCGASTGMVASRQVPFQPALPSPPRALLQTHVANHLPSPVTPVLSRKVYSTSVGIWKVQTECHSRSTGEKNSVLKQATTASPAPAALPFSVIHDDCFDECGGTPRKRRREATPIKMLSTSGSSNSSTKPSALNSTLPQVTGILPLSLCDVGVNTSQFCDQPVENILTSSTGHGRLPYRLRPIPLLNQMKVMGMRTPYPDIRAYYPTRPEVLANHLLSLTVLDGIDGSKLLTPPEEKQVSCDAIRESLDTVAFSTVDSYVLGLKRLLLRGDTRDSSSSTHVGQLSEALPLVLRHIDQRLDAAIDVLSTHSFGTVNAAPCSSTNKPKNEATTNGIGGLPRSSSSILPSTTTNIPNGAAYFTEDPFAGAPASQFIAPLMIHPRTGDPPRQASRTMLASSSCPNFSSDEPSPQLRERFDHPAIHNQLCCQSSSAYTLQSGIVSLHHLRSISLTLRSWYMHLASVDVCTTLSQGKQRQDSNGRGVDSEKMELLDVIVSLGVTISRLVSSLLRRLAIISLRRGLPNSFTYRSSKTSVDSALSSVITTTQSTNSAGSKQSYCNPTMMNYLSPEGLHVLSTYSVEVLNLTALLACWMPCEQQKLTWDFDMLDCFALCTNAWNCSSGCQTSTGTVFDEPPLSNSRIVYQATHMPVASAVFRLLRYLTACGAWTIGHWHSVPGHGENRDPKLPDACLEAMPSWVRSTSLGEEQVLRMNFLQALLNGRILRHDCQLLAILKWTQCLVTWACPHDLSMATSSSSTSVDFAPSSETWSSEVHRAELLNQVYAVLIELAVKPLQHLLTLAPPTPMPVALTFVGAQSSRLEMQHFISSLSQWIRALMGLLWRHGESCFQSYTDCLPAYFYLVANLARWMQQQQTVVPKGCDSSSVPRPTGIGSNLVEELYDFEATALPSEDASGLRLSQ